MMTHYKIEIRNSPGWRQHRVATLGVSVSSPNWHDEKFAATLSFAAANFDAIRIDVTDALYRHSFMAEGLSPKEAMAQANALGSLWLARHQDIIDDCKIKPSIVRWGEWYGHPDYETTLIEFQRAHELNDVLREAVHDDAMEFYRRKQQTPSLLEQEKSKDFMTEELAVLTLQARALPGVRLYPGEELRCLNVVRAGLVPEAPMGLENEQFAKVKFDKRGHEAVFDGRTATSTGVLQAVKLAAG
ncbi:MAG: tRNA-dependent cyclodipeptide synthase [Alphaproteobacteria bacterium]|nr:tRNA-dependent cyclodipeptide synthase [Alphaproteobacteria bacterium]